MEGRHLVVPLEPDVRFGAAANGQLGALIAKGDDPLGAGVVAVNQEGLAAPFGLDALLELSGRGEVGREGGSGHTGPRLRPLRARQAYARPGMVRPSLGLLPTPTAHPDSGARQLFPDQGGGDAVPRQDLQGSDRGSPGPSETQGRAAIGTLEVLSRDGISASLVREQLPGTTIRVRGRGG